MKKIILSLVTAGILLSCSVSKRAKGRTDAKSSVAFADTVKKDTAKKVPGSYTDVITSKAITDDGLLKVHRVDSKYYFEIADSLLGKDMLVVNRISKAAEGFRPGNGMLGYAGDYIGENVIRLEKTTDNKIFIRRVYNVDLSRDSSENGMYRSVYNSSLLPIAAVFDIKAYAPDSLSSVIDITDYIKGDNDILFFNPMIKKSFMIGALQPDKSYPVSIKSFPLNTEIKTVKTYTSGDVAFTYELNSSIVLLPAKPMQSRYYDNRVGYFSRGFRDFDYPQAARTSFVITRWRLEPKEEDIEKYKRGELVEPKKPIIFYIDPATPKKWVPYLIGGVNAWQKAFEKAGFKHAIYALEAPVNDSTWSIEDARHNAIIYKSSFVQNASGPQVSDPRSGEILESHINWYHNIQELLHDWYFIQASPNDPRARKEELDDALMGELIQYVCTHEVGHTLGLQHNFIASSSIPVDSLRSRSYVAANGHTPSIMDYARFNYVAQPEDNIDVKDLVPRIGVYDEWAIEWGYKWLPELKEREEAKAYMSKWIVQRVEKDKRLIFAGDRGGDYRNNKEDLGDDPVKAGYYGIKNLKRIMAHLKEWTVAPNNNYDNMNQEQVAVISQFYRYLNNVCLYIGGSNYIPKTIEQQGPPITYPGKEQQQAALRFLDEQLFSASPWFANDSLTGYTGMHSKLRSYSLNRRVMGEIINPEVYNGLLPNANYSFDELLTDVEGYVWKELKGYSPINGYRRTVQAIYIDRLVDFFRKSAHGGDFSMLDGCTIAIAHIGNLYTKITKSLPGYHDAGELAHLKDMQARLKGALKFRQEYAGEAPYNPITRFILSRGSSVVSEDTDTPAMSPGRHPGCWEEENILTPDPPGSY